MARTAMIAVFLTIIWLPMIGGLLHWDSAKQVRENRALAAFPRLPADIAGLRPFISGLERCFNDNFGFRRQLIHWAELCKLRWFSQTLQSKVIIGRNGWLFAVGGDLTTENESQQTAQFNPTQLQHWREVFETRRDWLAKRGIHYLVVVSPDKQTIYPEFLPQWVRRPGPVTKLDQFMACMKQQSTVNVADLRPALLEEKRLRETYAHTDSHWNQYGALAACNEIVRSLSPEMPALRPLPLAWFDERIKTEQGGNLAWMLTGAETLVEPDSVTLIPKPPLQASPVFATSTNWGMLHWTENLTRQGSALIFGDSFAEGWLPFLGHNFREVRLYRIYDSPLRASQKQENAAHFWLAALIENGRPDVVIDEIVESLFYVEDPAYIKTLDNLQAGQKH